MEAKLSGMLGNRFPQSADGTQGAQTEDSVATAFLWTTSVQPHQP